MRRRVYDLHITNITVVSLVSEINNEHVLFHVLHQPTHKLHCFAEIQKVRMWTSKFLSKHRMSMFTGAPT